MIEKLKEFISFSDKVDEVKNLSASISEDVKCLTNCHMGYKETIETYRQKLKTLEEQRMKETSLFLSVIDHIEDMLWAKDIEGRYIMANKAFREKFCYGMTWLELKGKTDGEIAKIFKEKVGDENHTFGTVCVNSDDIIHKTEEAREFLEHGKINGKLVKLVVSKSPVYDFEGVMFATCGTGRDVTEWHDDLEKAIEASDSCFGADGRELLLKELNKLEFREG